MNCDISFYACLPMLVCFHCLQLALYGCVAYCLPRLLEDGHKNINTSERQRQQMASILHNPATRSVTSNKRWILRRICCLDMTTANQTRTTGPRAIRTLCASTGRKVFQPTSCRMMILTTIRLGHCIGAYDSLRPGLAHRLACPGMTRTWRE
jgi:hypothetical protein